MEEGDDYKVMQKMDEHRGIQAAGFEFGPAEQHADEEEIGGAEDGEVEGHEKSGGDEQGAHGGESTHQPVLNEAAEGDFFGHGGEDAEEGGEGELGKMKVAEGFNGIVGFWDEVGDHFVP